MMGVSAAQWEAVLPVLIIVILLTGMSYSLFVLLGDSTED